MQEEDEEEEKEEEEKEEEGDLGKAKAAQRPTCKYFSRCITTTSHCTVQCKPTVNSGNGTSCAKLKAAAPRSLSLVKTLEGERSSDPY